MSPALAVLAALGSATCAGGAGTLQHATAERGRTPTGTATDHLVGFARHQLAEPLWWISLAVQAGSLVLHAAALHLGSLAVVQPVLALVVVLALPLGHHVHGTRITRTELLWAGLVTASLAVFLAASSSRSGAAPIAPDRLVLPAAAAAVAVGVCALIAHHGSARVAAMSLGAAAGVAFCLEAALLQATTRSLLTHPLEILASPGPYGLVLAGATGVALTQLAYRAGPFSSALPAIVTVNPVASVLLGSLLGAHLAGTSAGTVAAELTALAGLVLAVGALAHLAEQPGRADGEPATRPPRRRAPPA